LKMVIFHSYVAVYQRVMGKRTIGENFHWKGFDDRRLKALICGSMRVLGTRTVCQIQAPEMMKQVVENHSLKNPRIGSREFYRILPFFMVTREKVEKQGFRMFPVSIFHKTKSIDPTNLPTSLGYVLPLPGSILARTFFCRGPLIAPPHNIVSAPCRLPTGRVTCKAVGFAFCKEQGSKAGSSLQ